MDRRFLIGLFTVATALLVAPSKSEASDPYDIIGADTVLLMDDVDDRNAVIAVMAMEHLGEFFVNHYYLWRPFNVGAVRMEGHLDWNGGLNEGQSSYVLDLDYNDDGYLTIEDYYGFVDDARFDPNGLWGYVGMVEAQWTPHVESIMGNPNHNYKMPFDINRDGVDDNQLDRDLFTYCVRKINYLRPINLLSSGEVRSAGNIGTHELRGPQVYKPTSTVFFREAGYQNTLVPLEGNALDVLNARRLDRIEWWDTAQRYHNGYNHGINRWYRADRQNYWIVEGAPNPIPQY